MQQLWLEYFSTVIEACRSWEVRALVAEENAMQTSCVMTTARKQVIKRRCRSCHSIWHRHLPNANNLYGKHSFLGLKPPPWTSLFSKRTVHTSSQDSARPLQVVLREKSSFFCFEFIAYHVLRVKRSCDCIRLRIEHVRQPFFSDFSRNAVDKKVDVWGGAGGFSWRWPDQNGWITTT